MSAADENVKPQLTPEGKFALLLILCEFVVFALFLTLGMPEIGLVATITLAVLMIAVRVTWRLHTRRWYWVVIVLAAMIEVPVNLYLPWSNHAYRGTALTFFGFIDFLIVWGLIKLCEKVTSNS